MKSLYPILEQAVLSVKLLKAALKTYLRRQQRGPQFPNWSWLHESLVELIFGTVYAYEHIDAQELRTLFNRVGVVPVLSTVKIKPVRLGSVPGEVLLPTKPTEHRVVLFFHGGGYVAGSPRSHRLLTTRIAEEARARLYSMDYRLAPEHPYPAALEDAWIAYWSLLQRGVAPQQIVMGGDSAGAGLTVGLLLALREAQLPLPAAAFCLSPFFDLSCTNLEEREQESVDYVNAQIIRRSAELYLNGTAPRVPHVSPLYADLRGLPPLLIQASSSEFLAADAIHFANRAQAAGVDVKLTIDNHMIHVYQFLHQIVPEANDAVKELGHFVRKRTHRADPAEQQLELQKWY